MPQLFLFGDSITHGACDTDAGGWAQRLKLHIDQYRVVHSDYWCPVYPLGISGDTSAGLAKRITQETEARREPNEEAVFLIAIGINDSIVDLVNEERSVSEASYEKNLKSIYDCARKFSTRVAFMGLTPVDDKLLNPLPWDQTKAYLSSRVQLFDRTCRQFCESIEADFLSVYDLFDGNQYSRFLSDGLHPNGEGHELLFLEIKTFLTKTDLLSRPFR